jgi:hypothetical protein
MKHIVCLTKSYNFDDLSIWFKYHDKMGYRIHLIDNDSDPSISSLIMTWLIEGTEHTYEKLKGWPNQWKLFGDILNQNRYEFKKGDLIAFIDDDEFLWYYLDYWKMVEQYDPKFKGKVYEPLETYLGSMTKFQVNMGVPGCVLVPQTLMSTHDFWVGERLSSYTGTHFYRRNDVSTQGKAIVVYDPKYRYDFTVKSGEEYGHVPVIFDPMKEKVENKQRCSIVNGTGISNTTYGDVDYNACLRLYHYHIKSDIDWKKKFERGSAAVDHQWYAQDVRANKYFGGYDIPDFTMVETIKLMGLG